MSVLYIFLTRMCQCLPEPDAIKGRIGFKVASEAEPLLSNVQATGDIQPLGSASANSKVLAPAISLKFWRTRARASRLMSMAGNSRCNGVTLS